MYDDLSLQFVSNTGSLQIGRGCELKLTSKPEGIEFPEIEQGQKERNGYDGADYQYSRTAARDIAIDFGTSNIAKAAVLRDKVITFFNPKSEGRLTVNYFGIIRAITYRVVSVQDKQEGIFSPLKMHVELTCNEPYFEEVEESIKEISTWVDGLRFKFTLPFHLRIRGEPQVNVVNNGHVETPVQIIFKGPAYHPVVRLIQTGEYIKVKRELTSDDTLYIDTTIGVDSVVIERNGVQENAFSAIDWQSDFFQLRPGDNLLEYTTENDLTPQSVEVRYRERYLGV